MSDPSHPEIERSKMEAVYGFAQSLTIYGTPALLAVIAL